MQLANKGKNGPFWMSEEGIIHLSTNDKAKAAENFHVAISDDEAKGGSHPSLYGNLAKCLKAAGARMPGMS